MKQLSVCSPEFSLISTFPVLSTAFFLFFPPNSRQIPSDVFHDNESDFLEQSCTNSLASLNRVYEFTGLGPVRTARSDLAGAAGPAGEAVGSDGVPYGGLLISPWQPT